MGEIAALGRSPRDVRRGVAVLAYHCTPLDRRHPWWLDFRGQMTLVEALGYRVVSLDRVAAILQQALPINEPVLALTFDDGWADNLDVAVPELLRRGWPATVFVTTSFLGKRPYLSEDELAGLARAGIAAGNHTHTHPDLTRLAPHAARADVEEASRRLEGLTGAAPRHFCYPFGRVDAAAREMLSSLGFSTACTGRVGFNGPGADLLRLRRLTLDPGDRARDLHVRLAGGYDWLDRSAGYA